MNHFTLSYERCNLGILRAGKHGLPPRAVNGEGGRVIFTQGGLDLEAFFCCLPSFVAYFYAAHGDVPVRSNQLRVALGRPYWQASGNSSTEYFVFSLLTARPNAAKLFNLRDVTRPARMIRCLSSSQTNQDLGSSRSPEAGIGRGPPHSFKLSHPASSAPNVACHIRPTYELKGRAARGPFLYLFLVNSCC